MKEFEITLTAVSKKCFHLKADSKEDALSLAETILEDTDLLVFSDEKESAFVPFRLSAQPGSKRL